MPHLSGEHVYILSYKIFSTESTTNFTDSFNDKVFKS